MFPWVSIPREYVDFEIVCDDCDEEGSIMLEFDVQNTTEPDWD
jgi:hypothetical protein